MEPFIGVTTSEKKRGILHSSTVVAVFSFVLLSLIVVLLLRQFAPHWIPGFAIAFFLGCAVLLALAASILHRDRAGMVSVRELTAAADRIASGVYGIQVAAPQQRELYALVHAFNRMSVQIGQADAAHTAFFSSVSHELRTPLTAITGWSETLLYDDTLSPATREGLCIISKEAHRLAALAEELQQPHFIQDGSFSLNLHPTDIPNVLESVLFAYRGLLQSAGMELVYRPCADTLPPIDADPDRFKQVFLNLLENAVKYAKEGGRVAVAVSLQTAQIVIQFRDFGSGVPEEMLCHLSEWRYRGNATKDGNGIGLAVCKEIIARHGGTLEFANAKGGGLLVSIRLPVPFSA